MMLEMEAPEVAALKRWVFAIDRVQPGDMMQSAAVVASFLYHVANREERMPRKPLPRPARPASGAPLGAPSPAPTPLR